MAYCCAFRTSLLLLWRRSFGFVYEGSYSRSLEQCKDVPKDSFSILYNGGDEAYRRWNFTRAFKDGLFYGGNLYRFASEGRTFLCSQQILCRYGYMVKLADRLGSSYNNVRQLLFYICKKE